MAEGRVDRIGGLACFGSRLPRCELISLTERHKVPFTGLLASCLNKVQVIQLAALDELLAIATGRRRCWICNICLEIDQPAQ